MIGHTYECVDWDNLPMTKQELIQSVKDEKVEYFYTAYHKVIDVPTYLNSTVITVIPFVINNNRQYEPLLSLLVFILDMVSLEDQHMILFFILIILCMEGIRLSFMNELNQRV